MANKIKILDSLLASMIAAGEVVERPASVVKELVENSLDAGSSSVAVTIAEGGKRLIRVADDGCGISREDAAVAFHRHSTSKITKEDDLWAIRTFGFRGEALASVSSVARVRLRTKERAGVLGTSVVIEGGTEPLIEDDGCPEGTIIEVTDLFFNTPARKKFLRSTQSEYGKVLDTFKKIAIINPQCAFRLTNGAVIAVEARPGTLKDRIEELFGADTAKNIIGIDTQFVRGCIGTAELSYATAKNLYTYVNGRAVKDKVVNRAIIDGYGQMLDHGRYPFAVIDITVPPQDVDVNIHPAKTEVRFKNTGAIFDVVKSAVRRALALGQRDAGAAKQTQGWPEPHRMRASVQQAAESGASYASEQPQKNTAQPGFAWKGRTADVINPEFMDLRAIGQLWGEFLIAESAQDGAGWCYIIDQHGVEERHAFERLKKDFYSTGVSSQMLLLPERFDTTPVESAVLTETLPLLGRMGFEIIPFGPSSKEGGETFLIKAAPQILSSKQGGAAALVKDLVEELGSVGSLSRVEDKIEGALMTIACHGVIRGATPLTQAESAALLDKLASTDFAAHCPHGRPVVKRITRGEIEAFFKR